MSKWAALPDIDTTGSEVFETADVQGSFDVDTDSDLSDVDQTASAKDEVQDILTERLDVKASREKFRGSRLHGADFSHKSKQRTAVYQILPRGYANGNLRGVVADEREDVQARLKRLRFEVDDLELELEGQQTQQTQDGQEENGGVPAAAALLGQLRHLRTDLTKLSEPLPPTAAVPSQSGSEKTEKVDMAKVPQSLSELSNQLTVLERLIGPSALSSIESLASSNSNILPTALPLTSSISRLESQLQLLTQPRHFDTLSRRIKVIVTDLERIHETRRKLGDTTPLNIALNSGITVSVPGNGETSTNASSSNAVKSTTSTDDLPADILPRLQALFQMIPRLNTLAPITPSLLLRLRSLATLHSSASTFESRLSETTKTVATLSESATALQNILTGIQGSLESNDKLIQSNLQGLEGRISKLSENIAVLQS